MNSEWYLNSDGKDLGRFATDELYKLIKQGKVTDTDLVSTDQLTWMSVRDLRVVTGLAEPEYVAQPIDLPPGQGTTSGDNGDDVPLLLEPGDVPDDQAVGAPPVPGASVPPPLPQAAPPVPASVAAPGMPPIAAAPPVSAGAPPVSAGLSGGAHRDRIVILGRRAAGKTVYLATLYARLWKSLDGLTMKSSSGVAHRTAMSVVDNLTKGQWPAATLDNTTMVVDVEYKGRTRQMVSMDYSGEVFSRAFVEDVDNAREVRELLDHLDHAGAVMMLLDPGVSAGTREEINASVDDDFGMVQAVQRIRTSPGGENIPVVLVLTKMDQNLPLIKKEGSAADFVRNHWPALTRTLKHLVIFQVSAVQVSLDADGKLRPRLDSDPVNLENPLKFCLKEMDKRDRHREHRERVDARRQRERMEEEAFLKEQKETKLLWSAIVIGMLLVGLFVVAAIIVFS